MATRRADKHQVFNPTGSLVSEVEEDEPLEEYHEREYTERAETAISGLTSDIDQINTLLANWDTMLETDKINRIDDLAIAVRRNHRVTRAIIRLLLQKLDTLDNN